MRAIKTNMYVYNFHDICDGSLKEIDILPDTALLRSQSLYTQLLHWTINKAVLVLKSFMLAEPTQRISKHVWAKSWTVCEIS